MYVGYNREFVGVNNNIVLKQIPLQGLGHHLDDVHHAAAVAPLVIIPSVDLDHALVNHLCAQSVNNTGAGIVRVVDRHQRPLFVAQDVLHIR